MLYVAVDNETYLITRERPAPKVVCTSFFYAGMDEAELVIAPELHDFWIELLKNDNLVLIGLSIAYDTSTIAATYPDLLPLLFEKYRKNLVTDVGIRQQLFDIATGRAQGDDRVRDYSLAMLVRLIFKEGMEGKKGDGIWRLRYLELDGVPLAEWPEEALTYAKNDAFQTHRVWEAQNEAQDLIRYEHQRAYVAFVLRLMECSGMRTDAAAVAECRATHQKTIDDLGGELARAGLLETDRKGKQVKKAKAARERVIRGCLGRGVSPPLTKTGNQRKWKDPSFTWEQEPRYVATDKVAAFLSGDPLLMKRVKYTTAEKMLSTYMPVLEAGVTGPITTRFGLAATGRTTSGSPSEPLLGSNLQNAPRDGGIRECFVPRPGRVYISADFSGAELHTLAQTCRDKLGRSLLGESILAGSDPHLELAAELLGRDYETVAADYKAGDEETANARQDAKAANFGFPGGMREGTFIVTQIKQRERLWTYDEARHLRDAWLRRFRADEYFDYCSRELGPAGECVIEFEGTKMLRKVKGLTVICNSYFQSAAGAGALAALCEVSRRCYVVPESALYSCRPVNFIHDEIMLEAREDLDKNNAAAIELAETMAREFSVFTPDYPVKVEPVIMRRWSKKAKPVFDKEGRLIPWTSKSE